MSIFSHWKTARQSKYFPAASAPAQALALEIAFHLGAQAALSDIKDKWPMTDDGKGEPIAEVQATVLALEQEIDEWGARTLTNGDLWRKK